MEIPSEKIYNIRSRTQIIHHVTTLKMYLNISIRSNKKIILHRGSDKYAHIYAKNDAIKVEPTANYIHCETIGKSCGYRYLVKTNEPVLTKSMCYELCRMSQLCKTSAGTDTIDFIHHRDKVKYKRAIYVVAVCDTRPQKHKLA